jgi:acylphosphatase
MAAKQPHYLDSVLAAYFAFALFILLVLFVSPFFIVGAAMVVGYRVYRAYMNSPARLGRIARERSLELYQQARQLAAERRYPEAKDFTDTLYDDLTDRTDFRPPIDSVFASLLALAEVLYAHEGFALDDIPEPPSTSDLIENARYHDVLAPLVGKLSDASSLELARRTIIQSLSAFVARLPPLALDDAGSAAGQFTLPLMDACGNVGHLVEQPLLPFYSEELKKAGLFADLRRQVDANLWAVSGVKPGNHDPSQLLFPPDHPGPAAETVAAYLRYTPFQDLFDAQLPFAIDERSRMEHWHLVAGSGHGKTQTLQHVIMGDLQTDPPPALIIIDSQGDMLKKIERLALFEDSDRLIVIDPEDDLSPALNMFDVRTARLQTYSRSVREQVEAGIIELFNYVFGALASELTAKQGTAFAYITRLMLAIPAATIHTFRELMETSDPSAFAPYIACLDPTSRAFFDNQFFNRGAFGETRQQIARRLYTVLQVPAFERMFASPVNRLDMFAAMQGRKVVLVSSSKALLKTDASALFGRYMIALTLNAAFERVAVPERDRVPAYLIIDEAADYFDTTLERLLAQARKFNLGVLFAHQHMDQLSPALRAAVAANTSIKMAGGVSDHDARLLAPDMRTSLDFIGATRKRAKSTEFACYVRNLTDTAVRIIVPFGTLEDAPRMASSVHVELRARNRDLYSVSPTIADPSVADHAIPPELPRRRNPDEVDMHASEE